MFTFKIDVIEELKNRGYTSYILKKENLIGQQTIQYMRKGIVPGIKTLDVICGLLEKDIGDIIAYHGNADADAEKE